MTAAFDLSAEAIQTGLATTRIGRRVVVLPEAPSTNDLARELAEAGEPEGTVVVVDYQSAGRGRLGRTWLAPAGSTLPCSVLLRPTSDQLPFLTMAAGVAVCQAVQDQTGLTPVLKWPNDVLLDNRKLCGILLEVSLVGSTVRYAILGIGLNVNLDVEQYPAIAETATSLKQALGRPVPRVPVLRALLQRLDAAYDAICAGNTGSVWHSWRSRLVTLGQPVRVMIGPRTEEGIAEDVDGQGQLGVRRSDGSLVWLAAGEATLRQPRAGD